MAGLRSIFGDVIVEFPVVFKVAFEARGGPGEITADNDNEASPAHINSIKAYFFLDIDIKNYYKVYSLIIYMAVNMLLMNFSNLKFIIFAILKNIKIKFI